MTKEYEVLIDRKSSIKLRLLEDGEDISSHTQPIPIRHCKILSVLISKHSPNWYIKTLAAAYNFSQRPIRIGKNS